MWVYAATAVSFSDQCLNHQNSIRCQKTYQACGLLHTFHLLIARTHWGSLQRSTRPLAGRRGLFLREMEGMGQKGGGNGRKGRGGREKGKGGREGEGEGKGGWFPPHHLFAWRLWPYVCSECPTLFCTTSRKIISCHIQTKNNFAVVYVVNISNVYLVLNATSRDVLISWE